MRAGARAWVIWAIIAGVALALVETAPARVPWLGVGLVFGGSILMSLEQLGRLRRPVRIAVEGGRLRVSGSLERTLVLHDLAGITLAGLGGLLVAVTHDGLLVPLQPGVAPATRTRRQLVVLRDLRRACAFPESESSAALLVGLRLEGDELVRVRSRPDAHLLISAGWAALAGAVALAIGRPSHAIPDAVVVAAFGAVLLGVAAGRSIRFRFVGGALVRSMRLGGFAWERRAERGTLRVRHSAQRGAGFVLLADAGWPPLRVARSHDRDALLGLARLIAGRTSLVIGGEPADAATWMPRKP